MEWAEKKREELRRYLAEWRARDWGWRLRNLVNLLDDPVDDLKHRLHGMRVFGMTIYLPRWLMRGSGKDEK